MKLRLMGGAAMSAFRITLVAILMALGTALPAASQQHWLLGTWTGALTNLPGTNRFGADRTLEVKSVTPDGGTAQAVWTSGAGAVPIVVTIAGNELSFTTPGTNGSSYKLTHKGNSLDGSWTPNGGTKSGGSVSMKKK
jgi:hypothetical protein